MAINFPNSPVLDQSFTVGVRSWVYDGFKWLIANSGVEVVLDGGSAASTYGPTESINGGSA